MLFCTLFLALAGFSASSPTNFSPLRNRDISSDELHARALSNHPEDLTIESKDLHDFIERNAGSDVTVYLKDTRSFVPMSSVSKDKSKRQYTAPCYVYDTWEARDAKSEWGPWETASECLYNGKGEGTATIGINWSKSISITNEAGLDWTPIKDVLGVSLGFSVTNTWTEGGRIDCGIPPNSVGQIWVQKYLGEANLWKRMCQSCGASGRKCLGDWEQAGFVKAPSDGSDSSKNRNTGCSTGFEDVKC